MFMITPGINPAVFVWGLEYKREERERDKGKLQLPTEYHQTTVTVC
jgi:hypothetical protein